MKLHKKKIIMLLTALAIVSSNIHATSTDGFSIMINGKAANQSAEVGAAYMVPVANRVMVPTRIVAENMGFKVDWDQNTKKVTISNGTTTIVLGLNSNTVYVNGVKTTIDAPTEMKNSRIYVPVRFVSEVLGSTVDYNGADKVITITTGTNAGGVVTPPSTPTTGLVNINQLKPGVEYTVDQVIANKDQTYVGGKTDIAESLKYIAGYDNNQDVNTIKIKYGKFGDTVGGVKILDVGYRTNTKAGLCIKYSGGAQASIGIAYLKGNTITRMEAGQTQRLYPSFKTVNFGDLDDSPKYYKEAEKIAFFINGSAEILIVDKPSTEFKVLGINPKDEIA